MADDREASDLVTIALAMARWYAVVMALGLLALPLAWRLLPRLPDRGVGMSKALGIVLVGTALWAGTAVGIVRNDLGGATLAALGVGLVSVMVGWRGLAVDRSGARPIAVWVRAHVVPIIVIETMFFVAFVGWASVRAWVPAANHTEQPMDLLMLSAVSTSPTFPPRDPWLAGHPISYYYLGYWLVGTIGHLAGQPAEIAYNLGLASWFALLLTGCYVLGTNLAVCSRGREHGSGGAWMAGTLTAVAVVLTSNLHGLGAAVSELSGTVSTSSWWWWPSSRVISDLDLAGRRVEMIDEFPAFSYLLGDGHPHLLAMPIVVLVLSLALHGMLADRFASRVTPSAVLAVAIGALVAVNPSDVPAAWVTVVLASGASAWRTGSWRLSLRRAARVALVVSAGAAVVALPYLLGAQSQVQGIRPNLFHPTAPGQLLWMFGLFLPGLVALAWSGYHEQPPAWRHIALWVVVALVVATACLSIGAVWAGSTEAGRHWLVGLGVTPTVRERLAAAAHRWQTGWVALAAMVATVGLLSALIWRRLVDPRAAEPGQRNPASLFVLLIAGVGVALVAVPEVAYVADSFGTRMNTVFKLYYHAWLLLGIASAHGIFLAVRARGWVAAYGLAGSLVLLSGVTYLATGVYSRVAGGASAPTLDALAYVGSVDPDEFAAIHWMRGHTPRAARVIQGACASYRPDQCRVSVATGRATLLGWVGHERQWRGRVFADQAAGRQAALEDIYTSTDPERLREVLRTWAVDYVYVGRAERAHFALTPAREASLQAVMELAFQSGDARVYRRRN